MKVNDIKIILKTIPLTFLAYKKLFFLDIFLMIISGFFGVLIVYATSHLFNTVTLAVKSELFSSVVLAICFFFAVLVIKEIINWISDSLAAILGEKSRIVFTEMLHKKTNNIEPISFENSKLLDYIDNASRGAYFIDYCAKNILSLFLRDIPYLFFVGLYLYSLEPILFLIPLLIFFPVVISQFLKTKMFVELKNEKAPLERKLSHYSSYMTDTTYFKETRTLGCFYFFKKLYMDTMDLLNIKTWQLDKRSQSMEVISKLINLAGYYGVLLLLFFALMDGTISIGEFAAVFASMQMLYATAQHVICDRLGSIVTDEFAEINAMINFLAIPNRKYGKITKDTNGITLKNVSFSYPGRDHVAVKNINLAIRKGEILAIVGENGSGKTTLAKLILGIYSPTSGDIFSDDVSYTQLSRESLFGKKSAVFQNFYKYLFSLEANITISDSMFTTDDDRLHYASENAGVHYANLNIFPEGYSTRLSKQFGGVELSGGEWQRVAIARGFYKNSDIIVLDEPTAAIDPIEEGNVYRRFVNISKGKTAIIITHRLGSTKIADKIIVMNAGAICEVGTHEKLIQKKGLYATMFTSQAQWYAD